MYGLPNIRAKPEGAQEVLKIGLPNHCSVTLLRVLNGLRISLSKRQQTPDTMYEMLVYLPAKGFPF